VLRRWFWVAEVAGVAGLAVIAAVLRQVVKL
jgi:hypothetical protein